MSNVLPSGKQGHAGFLSKWIGYRIAARTFSLADSTIGVSNPTPEPNDVITYLITLKSILDLPLYGTTIVPSVTASNGVVSTPSYIGAGEWTFTHTQGIAAVTDIDVSYDGVAFPTETIEYAVTSVYVPWSGESRTAVSWSSQSGTITPNQNDTQIAGGKSILFGNNGLLSDSSNQVGAAIGTGNFTFELWFKRLTNSSADSFAYFRQSNHEVPLMRNNEISWYANSPTSARIQGGNVPVNEWHHLCWERYNGTIRCYVDGVSIVSAAFTGSLNDGTGDFTIGGQNASSQNINGYAQEWRISKVARYNGQNFTPNTTPHQNDSDTLLLLHGDTLADDAGSTLLELQQPLTNRAYVETTAYGGVSVNTTDYKTGYGSLEFDANGNLATENVLDGLDSQNVYTIETWLKADTMTTDEPIMGGYPPLSDSGALPNNRWVFRWENERKILFSRNINGTWFESVASKTLGFGIWYHIAVVSDGITQKIYIDGVEHHSRTAFASNTTFWTGRLTIGTARLGDNGFIGHLDNIRISKTARYTGNFTPSTDEFDNDADTLLLINGNASWADQLDAADATVSPPFDVTKSTVSVSNSSPTEGDTVTYTVTVRRGNGETINTNTPALTASTNNGSISTPSYQGNGVWTFTHSRSSIGTSNITIGYDGTNFPTESITYESNIQPILRTSSLHGHWDATLRYSNSNWPAYSGGTTFTRSNARSAEGTSSLRYYPYRADGGKYHYGSYYPNSIMDQPGNSQSWSFEMWFRTRGAPDRAECFLFGRYGQHSGFQQHSATSVGFTSWGQDMNARVNVVQNQWHQVAISWSNYKYRVYLDGQDYYGEERTSSNGWSNKSNTVYIGGSSHSSFTSNADISIIRVYTTNLSATDFAQNFEYNRNRFGI